MWRDVRGRHGGSAEYLIAALNLMHCFPVAAMSRFHVSPAEVENAFQPAVKAQHLMLTPSGVSQITATLNVRNGSAADRPLGVESSPSATARTRGPGACRCC